MPKRLPDKLFRDQATPKAAEVDEAVAPQPPTEPGVLGSFPPALVSRGVAPRLVVAGVLGALLLGFGIGRIAALNSSGSSEPTPSATGSNGSASPSSSPSQSPSTTPTLVPYEGPVTQLPVLDATGECLEGVSRNEPANLIDTNPNTFWRCEGAGAGEAMTFALNPTDTLVGVRVVNGNTVWPERYQAERRILSIQWTFSDGSWAIQGLAASDRTPQEIRFPPVTGIDEVTLTILDATVPGASDPDSDAVSISRLDFLTGS